MHMQSTHTVTHMHTYNNQPAGECVLDPHPLHLHTATRGFLARMKLQPASNHLLDESPMSARPPTGLRERERRKVGKGGEKRREIVSGLGGRQGRVWWSEEKVCNACCGCSGKADPSANVANAGMCAGKIIAGGFDRVMTHHQKITARVRREISARSARAAQREGDEL